jgi:hypothetical protein
MKFRKGMLAAGAGLLLAVALPAAVAGAQRPRVETAYFEGETTAFIQPAATSSNPNQGVFACFNLGPDLATNGRAAPSPPLYLILNPYATQDACPDGSLTHDHVLSTAPGHPGYSGSWTLILAVPGPNFAPSDMPFTSVAAVQAGVDSGELLLVTPGVELLAPVVG